MAVLQPNAYNGIYEMLKQRADQAAAMPPDTLGVAAKAVGQVGGAYVGSLVKNKMDADQEKELYTFKSKLQDELERNKVKYTAQGEGKEFVDQPAMDAWWKEHAGDSIPPPSVGKDGIYIKPQDRANLLKHAQFQTEVQKNADALLASKDPGDQRRGKFLQILSNLPDDKLDSVTDDIRKVLVPESEKSTKASLTKYTDPDTGEVMQKNNDTGEVVALSGPKNRPPEGTLVTKTEQLYGKEKTAIEKAKATTQKQVKPITDVVDNADSLVSDIEKNSPNTLTNIRAEVAKLAGIPGSRMGFQFLQQEGLNRGVAESIDQALTKAEGNEALSKGNKKALLDYVNSKKQEKVKQLKSVFSDNADGLSLPQVHPDLLNSELTKGYGRYIGFSVVGPKGEKGTVPKKGQKLPAGWTYAE